MPTIYLIALRLGAAAAGSLTWYWGQSKSVRQAADARTRDHIDRTYNTNVWGLSVAQAKATYDWARAQHA